MSTKDEISLIVAARAALLDLYGDRATSFVSLFVASIFGLVTVSAIIYSISSVISVEPTLFLNVFNILIVGISALIYGIFVYAVFYTFNKYSFYTDLADGLTNFELNNAAKLDVLDTWIKKSDCNKEDMELLKQIALKHEPKINNEDDWQKQITTCGDFMTFNWNTYQHYHIELQKKTKGKRALKSFKSIIIIIFSLLAILTYYPLIYTLLTHQWV